MYSSANKSNHYTNNGEVTDGDYHSYKYPSLYSHDSGYNNYDSYGSSSSSTLPPPTVTSSYENDGSIGGTSAVLCTSNTISRKPSASSNNNAATVNNHPHQLNRNRSFGTLEKGVNVGGELNYYDENGDYSYAKQLEGEFAKSQTSLKHHTFKSDNHELRMYCYLRYNGKTYYELMPLVNCLKLSNPETAAERVMPSNWIYKARDFRDPKFKEAGIADDVQFVVKTGIYYLLNECKSAKMRTFVGNMYETCFREIEHGRVTLLNSRISKTVNALRNLEDEVAILRKDLKACIIQQQKSQQHQQQQQPFKPLQ